MKVRRKEFKISIDVLLNMFSKGFHPSYIIEKDGAIPDDVAVLEVYYDGYNQTINILLASDEFEEIDIEEPEYPVLTPKIRELEENK
jgi:hypothetical protein